MANERIDYRTGERVAVRLVLVRHGHEWRGKAAEFPPGSVTRFYPAARPSFYIVRWGDGNIRVVGARSAHNGGALDWRLWTGRRTTAHGDEAHGALCEPNIADCYGEDGQPVSGPAWRPLARFAVELDEQDVRVAVVPTCPDPLGAQPSYNWNPGMVGLTWWKC